MRLEHTVDVVEERGQIGADLQRAVAAPQQFLQEAHVADEVADRHDREPLAHERVVGVVPLGALRVHPQAALGHEVGELHQQQEQELLCHRRVDHRPVARSYELRVASVALGGRLDGLVVLAIEDDRVVGVHEQVLVRLDPVGDVGVAEDAPLEQRVEGARVVGVRHLEQLLQVDDLVVAPVADVRPRVVGLGDFPLDPVAGDPVRVVAVGGGGVEERRHHALDVVGEGVRERFPVLEDVAPVALVVEPRSAVGVADLDREAVPGPARVAVSAAEGERQVGAARAFEVGVADRARRADEFAVGCPVLEPVEEVDEHLAHW